MITQAQRDLRNAIVHHTQNRLHPTTEALISVLGSVIEGVPIERAMGAPGDWGYGTPIGDALLAYLSEKAQAQTVIDRARRLYPTNEKLLPALMEEVGELSRALLDEDDGDYREEAIQVACVALRIATEGDSQFPFTVPSED